MKTDFVAYDDYGTVGVYPVVADIAACAANNATTNVFYPRCVGLTQISVNGWQLGDFGFFVCTNTAHYMREQLAYLHNAFKKPILLTEFGFTMPRDASNMQAERYDTLRSIYYLSYYNEMLKAIWEDGVHLMGALMWSWADNWEWGSFDITLGMQTVNLTSQERSYKRSMFDVVDFIQSNMQT